ncbi:MAG: hypothetical protein ACR2MB_16985 [Acidimicrobiales bacterium]
MADEIHVFETGQSWEVWRKGDSMPLGTFHTRMEADEHAAAQAEHDHVGYVDDELVEPEDGHLEV